MKLIQRWRPELISLIVAAIFSRFWQLFQPNAVVFDEVYFKAFAAHYLDHHYYFDIHPPLGKLLLGGWAWLLQLSPSALLDGNALILRIIPAAAGAALIPLVWALLRRLGASRPFAFLGAFLVLADNALTVESRFILMDSSLLLAGLGAIYCYLRARESIGRNRWLWLSLAASAAGAAASIKWTGLGALATIGVIWFWDQVISRRSWARRLSELAVLIMIPVMIYLAAFFAHFQLLTHSGDGDAFMTPRFQATLQDSPLYDPTVRLSFFDKVIELNREMYLANQTLTATHPYSSHWYTWPLEIRPIYYWQGSELSDGRQGNIYLLGNPVIWWGVWLAIILGCLYATLGGRKLSRKTQGALAIASLGFFINLLPFVAVARVMFLYHYFFSFIFTLIATVLLWNDLAGKNLRQDNARARYSFAAVIALVALGFCYFAPLTYGSPLTPTELQNHMWLRSWR